jgi:hypothetical protein
MAALQAQRQHAGFQQHEWQPPYPSGSSNESSRCGVAFLSSAARQQPKPESMRQGDRVQVIGGDELYVFLKEV